MSVQLPAQPFVFSLDIHLEPDYMMMDTYALIVSSEGVNQIRSQFGSIDNFFEEHVYSKTSNLEADYGVHDYTGQESDHIIGITYQCSEVETSQISDLLAAWRRCFTEFVEPHTTPFVKVISNTQPADTIEEIVSYDKLYDLVVRKLTD